jgi:orotidine-5'-phosphate decarboxylase
MSRTHTRRHKTKQSGVEQIMGDVPADIRERLAIALDVDDLVLALRFARQLRPYFGVAKIGLELYTAAGPESISALAGLGYLTFLDLKMHDIPTTVGRAGRVLGALGVNMVTMHAHGGAAMLQAGVEGLREGASRAGADEPWSLAITVLTSDADAPPHIMPKRVMLAAEAGCTGIVCAAADLKDAHAYAPRLKRIVPGIRMAGTDTHDQARAATPAAALSNGADLLVIGRAVTQAEDPVAAAEALVGELVAV